MRGSLIGRCSSTMEFLQSICHELWCVAASRARGTPASRFRARSCMSMAYTCRAMDTGYIQAFFVAAALLRHSSSDAHRHRGSYATLAPPGAALEQLAPLVTAPLTAYDVFAASCCASVAGQVVADGGLGVEAR